jgi:hypothetical protein
MQISYICDRVIEIFLSKSIPIRGVTLLDTARSAFSDSVRRASGFVQRSSVYGAMYCQESVYAQLLSRLGLLDIEKYADPDDECAEMSIFQSMIGLLPRIIPIML